MASTDTRLNALEQRLTRIEAALGITEMPKTTSAKKAAPAPIVVAPAAVAKPGHWLGVIAVLCFVLAAGFIIKLSIDTGWLTPTRQLGFAVQLGIALIGAGLFLQRIDRGYASLLPAAGVVVLYLTGFAAYRFYALIPFGAAIGITGVVSGLCIWLYTRMRHDIYALTAAVGAYLSPVLLDMHTSATFSMYYYLMCSVAFATISIGVKSRLLTVLAAYLAILLTGFTGANLREDALVATLLPLHFLVFAIGTYLYSVQSGKALTKGEANSFLPVLLIFYAMEYHFISRFAPAIAPWISLGFAGVLVALYLIAKQGFGAQSLASESMIFAFSTVAVFHAGYLELLPHGDAPWLLVIILVGFAISPLSLGGKQTKDSERYTLPVIGILLVLGIEYISLLMDLFDNHKEAPLLIAFAVFASIWFVLVAAGDGRERLGKQGSALLAAAHLLAIMGLFRLTDGVGSLAVSASWLFYGVAIILFAAQRRDEVMAKSALLVLSLAAGKALLYDAASAPTVVRILCLLLTGVVLYGTGLMMRRIGSWKN